MSDESKDPGEERLNQLIADYLMAAESGETPDGEALIEQHPDLADDLRSFLADHAKMMAAKQSIPPTQTDGEAVTLAPGVTSHESPTLPPGQRNTQVDAATLPPGGAVRDAPPVGTQIRYFGDYELIDEIARGGMGVVFRAKQLSLNRIVALKMILAGQLASEEDIQRFYAEAEAAANLDHPGIVPIHEVGEHEGQHYFSMGFVEGESLSAKIADGPLGAGEAARLVKAVAEAVQYAHDHGVIHRDLKPANVLLDTNGQPRVTDFGLAKQVSGDSNLTDTGQVLGTPSYMPPEQAAGKLDQIGPAADVYALGAILYTLITGRPPFQAANPVDTLLQVLDQEPVPPRQLNPRIPEDLETIALKCLEKDQKRRYATARDLIDELKRYLDGKPILARPIGPTARAWRWCRRNPVVAALEAGLVCVFLLGFFGVAWQWHRAEVRGREALGLLAEQYLDNGLSQCNQGEVARGMVWLARGLEVAPTNPSGHHRFRANLGYWSRKINQLRGMSDHPGPVGSVAFSPDGRTIATVCQVESWNEKIIAGQTFRTVEKTTGEVRLCDADTLRPIGQPLVHEGPVTAIAFSPDSKTLFTANGRGTGPQSPDPTVARLWDLETGTVLWRIPGRTHHTISAASFCPDGKSVVTGGCGGTPQIWDAATGKLLVGSGSHQGGITALAFSPDGKTILTGSSDTTARIWDTATLEPVGPPLQHGGGVHAVVFRIGAEIKPGLT